VNHPRIVSTIFEGLIANGFADAVRIRNKVPKRRLHERKIA
jgi:hypothetical protein